MLVGPDDPNAQVTVVIPARDESAAVVSRLVEGARRAGFQTVVVDDGSEPPLNIADVRHERSRGYGAAIKAGVRLASTEWVATLDGDGQHHPLDLGRLVEFLGSFSTLAMVVGDRRTTEPRSLRWVARKFLACLVSAVVLRWIPDVASGMRVFRRSAALACERSLSDGFSYPTELTLSMLANGYGIDWLAIRVRPRVAGASKVRFWSDGIGIVLCAVRLGLVLQVRRAVLLKELLTVVGAGVELEPDHRQRGSRSGKAPVASAQDSAEQSDRGGSRGERAGPERHSPAWYAAPR